MTDQQQITLERALELVEFELCPEGWRVKHVKSSVYGNVYGDVWGDVCEVRGNVRRDVGGNVGGTIGGRQWKLIETPRDKLERLIKEGADQDKIFEALDQLLNQL